MVPATNSYESARSGIITGWWEIERAGGMKPGQMMLGKRLTELNCTSYCGGRSFVLAIREINVLVQMIDKSDIDIGF